MKAAVMVKPGKIELIELPIPKMEEDEVLIKVKNVGICTWERRFYAGAYTDFPFIGGHEICGIVEKVGPKVSQKLEVGDKVVIAALKRCGECYYCRRGYDNQCEYSDALEQRIPGYYGPAGFAEYMVVRGYEVYKIPEEVSCEIATLAEPLACVTHSIDVANPEIGDYAVVLGAGIMGILHMFLAKQRGVTVIVSEPNAERREKALKLGADYVVDPMNESLVDKVYEITDGRGVELVFYTAGGRKAIDDGINSLAIRGKMVIYGSTSKEDLITLDPKIFHYREIVLTGVTKHTKESFRKAAEIISTQKLPLGELITAKYPFTEINNAFVKAEDLSMYRVVVEF
ncbi:MAG TPA: alcohol dehydrogenase catalytic domain-containing protein [Clostridia bacterium]|nr:alcohol dehydrogenase catalytic domain-containing protein [Clostridia bacterium]